MPFLVLSLPRSRSAWLSHFLTLGGEWRVGHDILIDCDSVEDFKGFLAGAFDGTCETGAALGWRLLQAEMPELRMLALRRPVEEVVASFLREGIELSEEGWRTLVERDAMLDAAVKVGGIEEVLAEDLDDPQCLRWMLDYLFDGEGEWDLAWWQQLRRLNIQVDMKARMEKLEERGPALLQLTREVLRRTLELGKEGLG